MSETQQQEPTRHRAENQNDHRYYPDDEIELMDYLLVMWKWKYIILAGTMAFALTAAIISFIVWQQQPTMYRTSIVLKPGVVKLDNTSNKVFIETPENIKALIENDLKYIILDDIKTSNNTNLSNSLDIQVDIPKGSNNINVSLVSALADEGTTKLNYLIKALLAEFANKVKYIFDEKIELKKNKIAGFQTEIENIKRHYLNQIEQKKTLLLQLKEKEAMARKEFINKIEIKKTSLANLIEKELLAKINFEKTIQIPKNVLANLSYEENKLKNEIDNYEQKYLEIESNLKILREGRDLSSNRKNILDNIAIENTFLNASKSYYKEKENAKYSLFKIKRQILEVSKNIKDLEKSNDSIQADRILQPDLYKIQKEIIKVSKEIKNLEKIKNNIKADPSLQPDLYKIQKDIINVSKELEKLEKGKNNVQNDSNYGKRLSDTQKNIAKISKEIETLEKNKTRIQTIKIIQPPITTEIPKTIKTKRNVALSSVTGLFMMLFLSFFGEYISKYKSRLQK